MKEEKLMAAATIFKLEDDFDFELIGICFQSKSHLLCWEINDKLNLDFSRNKDLSLILEQEKCLFTMYEYTDEENQYSLYLVSNKGDNAYLVPEKKECDYFILINNDNRGLVKKNLIQEINKLERVLAAFEIDPEQLKSRNNLLIK